MEICQNMMREEKRLHSVDGAHWNSQTSSFEFICEGKC